MAQRIPGIEHMSHDVQFALTLATALIALAVGPWLPLRNHISHPLDTLSFFLLRRQSKFIPTFVPVSLLPRISVIGSPDLANKVQDILCNTWAYLP